ncbi:MAG: 1-acyl-sn-glycerol-3-phosphate acyltransferase [Gemmatimonadota bacterium]|nr:1-acyl-sn-glycerol-3-phosphate acyltransferase [Gemmatimonadota bacterium]
MRSYLVFLLLFALKLVCRAFFRVRLDWLKDEPDPWSNLRVLALLNHTSLFEPVFVAAAPNRLLWQLAAHGVLPVANKTMERPLVGRFFRLVARHVIPITRERDDTWELVLDRIHDPKALIVILPEGRMMRPTGLDLHGNPMTVRGGIADLFGAVKSGKLFLGHSHGLHHIHAPGDRFPKLFQRVTLACETIDIPEYRAALIAEAGEEHFKRAVIEDLTRRRDECCPRPPVVSPPTAPASG